MKRFPHEFSGGQRQRIAIARALVLSPKFIVADEPSSALDKSIQAQILNLMKSLQADLNISYLFITHNLSAANFICDRIAVMYLGKIVEMGTSSELVKRLFHPYTRALWASTVARKKGEKVFGQLKGDVFEYGRPEEGCVFAPRCPVYKQKGKPKKCTCEEPELKELKKGHLVACHFPIGKK